MHNVHLIHNVLTYIHTDVGKQFWRCQIDVDKPLSDSIDVCSFYSIKCLRL